MSQTEAVRSHVDEASLLAILDSVPHLVTLWDPSRRCLFANAAGATAYGRPAASMRGIGLDELVGPHAIQLVEHNIAAAIAGEATETDRVLFDGDGGLRHFQVHYTPHHSGGVVAGYSTTWVDVTAQMYIQAEVARDSEQVARLAERHRLLVVAGQESLDDLADIADAMDWQEVSSSSGAGLDALGEKLARSIARLREGAEAIQLGLVPEQRGTQAPYVIDDWSPEPGAVAEPVPPPFPPQSHGDVHRDLALIATMLDQLPLLVTEWDTGLHLRFANRAALRFAEQWGAGALLGRRLRDFVDEDFLEANRPYFEAALRGEAQSFYRRQQGPAGAWQHFHVRYMPRFVGGEVVGAYAYATDITTRIEAGEALTAARADYAALRERQAIEDELHGATLQELFGAKLAVEMAARAAPDQRESQVAAAQTAVTNAVESLRALLASP